MKLRTVMLATLIALALAACGGSDSDVATPLAETDSQDAQTSTGTTDQSAAGETTDDELVSAEDVVEDAVEGAEELAEGLVDSLETAQAASGGGSATLTVGDQTWTFESVLCAFGPDEIGQEGAEFVMSSLQDGLQFYVSIDTFGHSVSLNDIKDFTNPSVALSSPFGAEDIIALDGKSFSGSAEFMDDTSDSFETTPGTFSGTCP